jgi:protein phosphatase
MKTPGSAFLDAFGLTDQGPARRTNEDRFLVSRDLGLFLVADGMGGHNAGEVAAGLAVEAVLGSIRGSRSSKPRAPKSSGEAAKAPSGVQLLSRAIEAANARILEAASRSADLAGMGTTIVAALIQPGRLAVAHVGDSRAYLHNRNGLQLLTRDDSWVAVMLAENPGTSPAALRNHPMRNVLTNVVGTRAQAEVHVSEHALSTGDTVILTTDGVHGFMDDAALEQTVEGGETGAAEIAARLVRRALESGSSDNCTAVVVHYRARS